MNKKQLREVVISGSLAVVVTMGFMCSQEAAWQLALQLVQVHKTCVYHTVAGIIAHYAMFARC